MYTKWTSHLSDPEEKERFLNLIVSSKPVLDRLAQLIKEDEDNLHKVERSAKQFDSPNWSWRQAFYNGSIAAYFSTQKLIDLDQQDINHDRKHIRQHDDSSTTG